MTELGTREEIDPPLDAEATAPESPRSARRGVFAVLLPPFLVGIVAAVAAEVAAGMLLYDGPGLTRSLTTILTVEAMALAAGLAVRAPRDAGGGGMRARWTLALFAFLLATVFATVWILVPTIGSGRLGQGTGLALLAALPLYSCGSLLGALSAVGPPRTSAIAAFGAAAGFLATGILLPRAPMPSSLTVGCLVLLSLAATVHSSHREPPPP